MGCVAKAPEIKEAEAQLLTKYPEKYVSTLDEARKTDLKLACQVVKGTLAPRASTSSPTLTPSAAPPTQLRHGTTAPATGTPRAAPLRRVHNPPPPPRRWSTCTQHV